MKSLIPTLSALILYLTTPLNAQPDAAANASSSSSILAAVGGPYYTTQPFLQFKPSAPGATPGVNEWLLPQGSSGPNNETTTFEFAVLTSRAGIGLEFLNLTKLVTLGPGTVIFTSVMDYTEHPLEASPTREPSTVIDGTYTARCEYTAVGAAVCEMDKPLREWLVTGGRDTTWWPTMTVLGEERRAVKTGAPTATQSGAGMDVTARVEAVVVVAAVAAMVW